MRLSLRELLAFVAFVAMAIVSLKYASDTWLAIVGGVTMLAFFVSLIVAVVDRGPRQVFAIGFALITAGYGLIVTSSTNEISNLGITNVQFEVRGSKLPTTQLLQYVHVAVDVSKWIDFQTGKEIPGYDPSKSQAGGRGSMYSVGRRVVPPREVFMPIGHCWWGLLLGYLGGIFAVFVYSRRIREQQSLK